MTPPTVRMTVFIPRRDAGLGRAHGLGDERRHRREGEADADAEDRHRGDDLPRLVMPHREHRRGDGDEQHPDRERPLESDPPADAARRSARRRAARSSSAADRGPPSSRSRRSRSRRAAPTSSGRPCGVSTKFGTSTNDAEHREAGDERGDVREQHRPPGEHPHVDHRLGHAQLDDHPERRAASAAAAKSRAMRADVQPQLSPSVSATQQRDRARRRAAPRRGSRRATAS